MQTVLFDIDGTLADLTHRLHHVTGTERNWGAFFDASGDDSCYEPMRDLLLALSNHYTIFLVSGRPDTIRDVTEMWMARHDITYNALLMRRGGDHRSDVIVKSEILDEILSKGHEVAFVVDDRPTVVEMWRQRGLTCLQCRDWEEGRRPGKALLTLMVGPSGAGKTTWLKSSQAVEYGIHPSHILSSDQFRHDLCGDFVDQSRNIDVFKALHAVARERLKHGLPTVIDATNLRRRDRLACVGLNDGGPVRYIVIDRPMEDKRLDAGWRADLPFDLLAKHENTFKSQEKDVLAGDNLPNIKVIDVRGK